MAQGLQLLQDGQVLLVDVSLEAKPKLKEIPQQDKGIQVLPLHFQKPYEPVLVIPVFRREMGI